jgi:methyl-accepting chemotaxis protein
MVILVAIGMGASTAVSYFKSKEALVEASKAEVGQLVKSTLGIVDEWFSARKLEIRNWSSQNILQSAVTDTFVGKAARNSANRQLAVLKEQSNYYENIFLATLSGEIVAASTDMSGQAGSVASEIFFKNTLELGESGQVYVSPVSVSETSGNPVFVLATPLKNNGMASGVLYGVVDIQLFNKRFIDSIEVGKTGYAFAFDKKGLVIAHTDKSLIMKMNITDYEFGRYMLSSEQGLHEYILNDQEKLAAFATNPELGWTIVISASADEILASVKRMGLLNLVATSAIIVLSVICILLIVSSIVRPINKSLSGLGQAVEQVVTGATEVASSSQTLSSGASEQAATIEETSSSLEEMSSTTRQNAGNAGAAKAKMTEAIQVVQKVNQHMDDMTGAIQEITQSSEETGKIIKTIDEIAFQTNLLALNAAVEAARAGEAGAGFAVVADEVRNLALKAAGAAKTTTELIEKTVKAVQKGNDLTQSTREAFQENIEISEKVSELVEEIAVASSEQAQGIEEINRAVAEMDKVVQQVAATAEESAAASEEMNGQAVEMENFVRGLDEIVFGKRNGVGHGASLQLEARQESKNHAAIASTAAHIARQDAGGNDELPEARRRDNSQGWTAKEEVDPKRVIPMMDEDFKDF